MATKKENIKTKLADFPEEIIAEERLKIYGETSYENQMAVLSHFLHNHPKDLGKEQKEAIVSAVREFLSRKEFRQGFDEDEMNDEEVLQVAESPLQYNLFSDFFDVPFPTPEKPKFTFIDLFDKTNFNDVKEQFGPLIPGLFD